ncbi:hypothetical protein AMTR_s00133p00113310 [Amborella trichopoda]|uniref:Uncharacterized protein n=1 Tax=Amborella trichopoda TaxID=13333 RepID=W1PA14_AMBTC|nr:hypothetical protein AMTR_s00133p00113310 [Amborella trichopoda]
MAGLGPHPPLLPLCKAPGYLRAAFFSIFRRLVSHLAIHLYPFETKCKIGVYTLVELGVTAWFGISPIPTWSYSDHPKGKYFEFLEKQYGNGHKENDGGHEYDYRKMLPLGPVISHHWLVVVRERP